MEQIRDQGRAWLAGLDEEILPLLVAGWVRRGTCPVVVVTAERDSGNRAVAALDSLLPKVHYFPPNDDFPRSSLGVQREIIISRLETLRWLSDEPGGFEREALVVPLDGLLQPTLSPPRFRRQIRSLAVGDPVDPLWLARSLVGMGYETVDRVECVGQFSRRGGILDVYVPGSARPCRIEFHGETVASLRGFSPVDQRSIERRDRIALVPAMDVLDEESGCLLDYLPGNTVLLWYDPLAMVSRMEALRRASQEARDTGRLDRTWWWECLSWSDLLSRAGESGHLLCSCLGQWPKGVEPKGQAARLDAPGLGLQPGNLETWKETVVGWLEGGKRVVLVCNNEGERDRLREILSEVAHRLEFILGCLERGFHSPDRTMVIVTDQEIFRRYARRYLRQVKTSHTRPLFHPNQLEEGDLVVHAHFGIGRYKGLERVDTLNPDRELLCIEYAHGERLFLPVEQLHLVDKYIGSEDRPPLLHSLGGNRWQMTRRRVSTAVLAMARELLDLYAAREALPGFAFPSGDEWQKEFETSFVYEETPDQAKAIEEVRFDMESRRPMDRLVCGDVGYGKTEVAMRAAFKACMAGKQVAVLVPTTVLAQQHFKTFTERMADYPLRVAMLSRFLSGKEQKDLLHDLKNGTVDVVIGTHRLIQKDVAFKDLGLVVIDEEQRFGVVHKEKLKRFRRLVDVLTLTATPIPRTLHMSLMGIRDMSVMETPPERRLPVETHVETFDMMRIRQDILKELDRQGQAYFVHNRVETIDIVTERLRQAVPEARFRAAHGQLPERLLERIMLDFYDGQFDVLVCTTIIESGLDVPNVNTIFIDRADCFGLAQLHQLRGRVGRYVHRAYAKLLVPRNRGISQDAKKRLAAIVQYDQLGAGFQIAMRDLEIRGAGNLLGSEQHGMMLAVGFNLYLKLLKRAVAELKGERPAELEQTLIDCESSGYLPSEYVPGEAQRIEIYRQVSRAESVEELNRCLEGMRDRFGTLPPSAQILAQMARLRIQAGVQGLRSVRREREGFLLCWTDGLVPADVFQVLEDAFPGRVRLAQREDALVLALDFQDVLTEREDWEILRDIMNVLE